MKRALVLTLTGLACGQTQPPVHDAAVEHPTADAIARTPDGPPALVVDFSVEGCPAFDAENLSCVGAVPLTLQFVPLVTSPVTQYVWDFGDPTPTSLDTGPTPSHVYTLPGVYTVSLWVQSADGTPAARSHAAFVDATASSLGDPCDLNEQCREKLFCLCSSGNPCGYGPAHGTCAALCQSGTCGQDQVCARLLTTPSSPTREPWQTSLCLRGCSTDAECSGQLRCRNLPAGNAWVRGCFSDVPADVGASCLDAEGVLRDDLCASGICRDLGVKGLCTMACLNEACPPGSDCAVLGDGRTLCLRRCTSDFDCSSDSLLACVGPGTGDLGYQPVDPSAPSAAAGHCAPKACASHSECLPSGRCEGQDTGGHCALRRD
jgi:hypothetical protein